MVKSIDIAKVTFLLVLFVSTARAQSIFDVTKDGAKANGPDINAVILQCNKKYVCVRISIPLISYIT